MQRFIGLLALLAHGIGGIIIPSVHHHVHVPATDSAIVAPGGHVCCLTDSCDEAAVAEADGESPFDQRLRSRSAPANDSIAETATEVCTENCAVCLFSSSLQCTFAVGNHGCLDTPFVAIGRIPERDVLDSVNHWTPAPRGPPEIA
jgi:hypothetical protein